MTALDARRSTSSRLSSLSASATVVNPASSQNSPISPNCVLDSDSTTSAGVSTSSDEDDNEEDVSWPEEPIRGWPQLALLMAKTPDLAAFSRFRDLNVKSLLYYQAELTILRKRLHDLEYKDAAKGEVWAERADKLVETESDQFKTVKRIREVLKEYNESLLQFSKISALPDPEPFNMRTLRKWLRYEKGAHFRVRGRDNLENSWGDVYTNPDKDRPGLWKQFGRIVRGLLWAEAAPKDGDLDLVVLNAGSKIDGFTRWAVCDFVPFYTAVRKHWRGKLKGSPDIEKTAEVTLGGPDKVEKKETLETWSERSALRVTSGISTVVACLLPVVAISVLSQLHQLRDLLLCMAGFAVIFAVGLIFLTQGTSTRVEIFAATAAFSAVLVVFISVPPAPVIVVPPGSPTPSVSPSPIPSL